MPVDKTYELKTGQESIPEYNSRIAAYNASKTAPTSAPSAPSTPSTSSGSSEYYPRYTSGEQAASDYLDSSFKTPQSTDQIQQQKMQAAQAEVDNLNKMFDSKLAEQRVVNEGRSRGTASVNTLTGLGGSTEANVHTDKTNAVNKRENDAINNERAVAIGGLFSKIRSDAVTEAQNQRLEARQSADQILAGRTQRQEEAAKSLTLLAQSGVTLEGLKQSDPESYTYFARNVGEPQMQAMITLNRPQEQILDKRVENGKYVIAYQNALDGRIRIESVDLGLPPNYSKSIDAGDRMLFVPDQWDGDTTKLISVNKGLTPAQANKGTGAAGAAPGAIVDANGKPIKLTATQVDTVSGFDNTVRSANEALTILAKGVKTGPVAGAGLQANKYMDAADPDQLKLEQTLSQIKASYMKALSGAAVSEQEVKRLAKFLPDIYDQEGVLKSKLETLLNDSSQKKTGFLSTLGAAGSSSQTVVAPDGTEVEIID